MKKIENNIKDSETLSLNIKSLQGSFKLPKDFNYKKILLERLSKKYL